MLYEFQRHLLKKEMKTMIMAYSASNIICCNSIPNKKSEPQLIIEEIQYTGKYASDGNEE